MEGLSASFRNKVPLVAGDLVLESSPTVRQEPGVLVHGAPSVRPSDSESTQTRALSFFPFGFKYKQHCTVSWMTVIKARHVFPWGRFGELRIYFLFFFPLSRILVPTQGEEDMAKALEC